MNTSRKATELSLLIIMDDLCPASAVVTKTSCQRRNQNQESSGDESDQEDLDDTTFAKSFDFDPETFGFKVISWRRALMRGQTCAPGAPVPATHTGYGFPGDSSNLDVKDDPSLPFTLISPAALLAVLRKLLPPPRRSG